jgi:hypothetical protein
MLSFRPPVNAPPQVAWSQPFGLRGTPTEGAAGSSHVSSFAVKP